MMITSIACVPCLCCYVNNAQGVWLLAELVWIYIYMFSVSNTPGTRGWSRLRDRTPAVAKNRAKMTFFSGGGKNYLKKYFFCIYLLVMPKYWGKRTGDSPKWVKSRRCRKKKKKRKKKVGENNGQLRFVRHHVWRTQARLDQKTSSFSSLAALAVSRCGKARGSKG